jgi:hypothetical protein
MTMTGALGGGCFGASAGADKLWSVNRRGRDAACALARVPGSHLEA